MKVKAIVFFYTVFVVFKMLAADCCKTNLYGKEVMTKYSEGFTVTNVTKVGWQILSTLEGAIDARCVLFLYSLRQCSPGSIDKEICRKKLKEACLYGRLFSVETENAFRVVRALEEGVYDQGELTKDISATVTLNEERAREEFYKRDKMWTSPPLWSNSKNLEIKFWMTEKEQYENMMLYAYYKSILLKSFCNYLENKVLTDNKMFARFQLTSFDFSDEDDMPSEDEISFVLSVINIRGTNY